MSLLPLLLTGLLLVGCLSPLLTFAALFQQKEWRIDRLREHLRHEGYFRQLFGKMRPILVLVFLLSEGGFILLLSTAQSQEEALDLFAVFVLFYVTWLTVFALLSIVQIILRRQRYPVWTKKSIMITGLSITIAAALSTLSNFSAFSPAVILLVQPIVVLAAWLILQPVDRALKGKVFSQAGALRSHWKNAVVIGIAGSVGKTTTKELLKCVLADLQPLTTPEHVNSEMGVAQWMITQGSQLETQNSPLLIIEMGAYRQGEIALMCEYAKPTIGVMTALGSDHLALFGSEEAIVDANAELLRALPEDGHAFLYADNDAARSLAASTNCSVTLAGTHEEAELRAENIQQTNTGLSFSIFNFQFSIPLHGLHNIGNALLAIAVARHLGISDSRIAELLKAYRPLSHSFNVRTENGVMLVDDTYNSSRLSIRAAIDWAKSRHERPRVLLMSDLLETGAEEEVFLREIGELAANSIERVILTTKKSKQAFESGYGKPVEILSKNTSRVEAGSLLLCVGRMPLSSIQKIIP